MVDVFIHPEVTLREALAQQLTITDLDIRLIDLPLLASHIVLPLPPPPHRANTLSARKNADEISTSVLSFIVHRGDRLVLSQYWLIECLRTEEVVPAKAWDLAEWGEIAGVKQTVGARDQATPSVEMGTNGNAKRRRITLSTPESELSSSPSTNHISRPTNTVTDGQNKRRKTDTTSGDQDQIAGPSGGSVPVSINETPTRPRSESRIRFSWSPLGSRPSEEILEVNAYFYAYSRQHLQYLHNDGGAIYTDMPESISMGTVQTVPSEAIAAVQRAWVDARRRYTRRNLDHMSVMLSAWKTGRTYNLSPTALRSFYDANKRSIRQQVGPYIPTNLRTSDWPFRVDSNGVKSLPIDPECLIDWVPDWGQPKCAEFLGFAGGQAGEERVDHDAGLLEEEAEEGGGNEDGEGEEEMQEDGNEGENDGKDRVSAQSETPHSQEKVFHTDAISINHDTNSDSQAHIPDAPCAQTISTHTSRQTGTDIIKTSPEYEMGDSFGGADMDDLESLESLSSAS